MDNCYNCGKMLEDGVKVVITPFGILHSECYHDVDEINGENALVPSSDVREYVYH